MSVAGVAHPVERHLAKVEVASSSLVTRSIKKKADAKASAFLFMELGGDRLENINASLLWRLARRQSRWRRLHCVSSFVTRSFSVKWWSSWHREPSVEVSGTLSFLLFRKNNTSLRRRHIFTWAQRKLREMQIFLFPFCCFCGIISGRKRKAGWFLIVRNRYHSTRQGERLWTNRKQ